MAEDISLTGTVAPRHRSVRDGRPFPTELGAAVIREVEAWDAPCFADLRDRERARWALRLLFHFGFTVYQLSLLREKHLRTDAPRWLIQLPNAPLGTHIALSQVFVRDFARYRAAMGLSDKPLPHGSRPLIVSGTRGRRTTLSTRAIIVIVKQACARIQEGWQLSRPVAAKHLATVLPIWLRHQREAKHCGDWPALGGEASTD